MIFGDVFVIRRLDHCSRSVLDLYKIIETLNKKGVSVKATKQEIDTSTSSGKLVIELLSIVAEFERKARFDNEKTAMAL